MPNMSLSQVNTVIINEQFNDNSNLWDIHDEPEALLNLSNGQYHMEGKMLGRAITSTINVSGIENNDYKISAEITKLNGIDDNGFGIIWGAKDENNEYEFVISGNGQFKVIEWKDGVKKDLVAWTFYGNIQKWDNATNRLRVEKRGKFVKFFINDNYVAVLQEVETFGNKIGFVLNETMKIACNYLIYEKIERENTIEFQSIKANILSAEFNGSIIEPELRYGESTVLKVVLKNTSELQVNNLALMISSAGLIHDLEYNRINMIEMIPAYDNTIVSVSFSADEEIESGNYTFNIDLVDGNTNILDSKTVNLKIIGRSNYYVEKNDDYSNPNKNNPNNNQKYSQPKKSSADGCTKGCSYLTLATLIVGLIMAIL